MSTIVYNTNDLKPSQLPRSILGLADPKWKGKLALSPGETDFQPIVTAVAARYGKARALKWLEGIRSNASSHIYPDNETLVAQVNSGQAELGVINHYYWYRLRDELGASKIHSAEHFFAPGDPGLRDRRLGSGRARVELAPGRGPEVPGLPRQQAGAGDPRPRRELRVPARIGRQDAPSRSFPFATLKPDPITIAQLGNGSGAITLLRQASLL